MYRILIVDDERLEREAFKFILQKGIDHPIEIQEAENGRESIILSRTFKPDIVFMDIKMPGIDGIEAARSITEELPGIQIVFLTAFRQFEYAREAIHVGAIDYLIKPSSEDQILKITDSLINRIETQRREMNRQQNNELKLSRVAGYLENEFILSLAVRGINREKFFDYVSILDLSFLSGRGGIMKIQYESYPLHIESDYQKTILKKRCNSLLKSTLRKADIIILSNLELSNIYFMMSMDETSSRLDDSGIRDILYSAEGNIRKELSIKVNISFGDLFLEPEDAPASFVKAGRNIGTAGIFPHSNAPLPDEGSGAFPVHLELELEKAVLKGRKDEALEIFRKIRDWLLLSPESIETKRQILTELATVLKHSAAYQFPNGTCSVDDTDIRTLDSQEHLLSSFQFFLNTLLDQISFIPESDNDPIIDEACDYIEKNYHNDISLEDVAALGNYSSYYFSKLFKRHKGITFIEYLTNRRIDEAKKLLTDTRLSIKEISRRVGYNDPNYFNRVFKRIEKVSPSYQRTKK